MTDIKTILTIGKMMNAKMKMKPVTSSAATHIGHDGTDLHVTYKGGKTYVHRNVPAEVHAQLLDGRSIGQALNTLRKQYPGVAK
jgi:hypothetical protein